jgi:hypothetical protein
MAMGSPDFTVRTTVIGKIPENAYFQPPVAAVTPLECRVYIRSLPFSPLISALVREADEQLVHPLEVKFPQDLP